jgi:hypothetical protein
MKKVEKRRLVLSRETLRLLTQPEISSVHGAEGQDPTVTKQVSDGCPSNACTTKVVQDARPTC